MKVHYHSKEINKALIGTLNRTMRKESLEVLWYFNKNEIPDDDQNPKTFAAKNIVKKEEWGEKFYRYEDMDRWLENYWKMKKNGNTVEEKIFKLSFPEADEMINKSKNLCTNPKEAALTLEVENIDDPIKVRAKWKEYIDHEWDSASKEDLDKTRNNSPLVFKLDPYFFRPWEKSYAEAKQNEFKVFKGYIIPNQPSLTFDYKFATKKYKYKNLSLVGRIISRPKDANKLLKTRVIISVANLDEYLIEPWTSDGPNGHGGGGSMP